MEWFKFSEKQPDKEGAYLVATHLDNFAESGTRFVDVGTAKWFNEGHFVDCSTSDEERIKHVVQQHFTPALKDDFFNEAFAEPMGYHVARSGFYDNLPGPSGRMICINKSTLFWAELPKLPSGYKDQNAYMDWVEDY